MLGQIRIASPCSADWERMPGSNRVRYCAQCNRSVYNFSALTPEEVGKLVANRSGRLCARFYQRADGTMLSEDCPVGFRARVRRVSRVAGAALSAVMSLGYASAQNVPASNSLVQIEPFEAGIEVEVVDETGAVIPNTNATLIGPNGNTELEGVTDLRGQVYFPSLTTGRYSVRVSAKGFQTVKAHVDVPTQHKVRVKLRLALSVALMGEVVSAVPVEPVPQVVFPLQLDDPQTTVSFPATAPISAPAPRRNPIVRFVSAIGHRLRL